MYTYMHVCVCVFAYPNSTARKILCDFATRVQDNDCPFLYSARLILTAMQTWGEGRQNDNTLLAAHY